MIQEIIVYSILIVTFGLTFYKLIGFFEVFRNGSTKSACGTCSSGSCGSCSLKPTIEHNKPFYPLKVDHEKMKI